MTGTSRCTTAWLTAGARRVDVHYRDLDDVEHQLAEAQAGRFGIERLLFHLAGTLARLTGTHATSRNSLSCRRQRARAALRALSGEWCSWKGPMARS